MQAKVNERDRSPRTLMPGDPMSAPLTDAARQRTSFLNSLFRLHYAELVGRLRKVYGAGPPDPEDVAQTAFSKIAELDDLERIHSPRAFLFRTAVNICLNSNDKLKRSRAFVRSQLESNFSQRLEEKSAESVFMGKQDLERVAHVIRQLPPKQREILLRSRFRGQTYDEIRQETGWSQADISRQLNKVMALLQAELDR